MISDNGLLFIGPPCTHVNGDRRSHIKNSKNKKKLFY